MNRKTFFALLATALFGTALIHGALALPSQSVEAVITEPQLPLISPVDIAFDADLDRLTSFPTEIDREQSDSPIGSDRAVSGLDDRYPILTREFPWATIGRLEWQYNNRIISTCTATLIDSNLVLTNSHCLILPQQNSAEPQFISADRYNRLRQSGGGALKLVFKPSMIRGVSLNEATVVTYQSGWSDGFSGATEDWAVLKLDENLGNRYGYLGWRTLDLTNSDIIGALAENTLLAGYSGDFPTARLREFGEPSDTAGVDLQCSILGIWPQGQLADTIVHDCDTNPGASGAPILAKFTDGNYYIIGLHSRQVPLARSVELPNGVRTSVINGGVKVSNWAPTAFQMLSPGRQ